MNILKNIVKTNGHQDNRIKILVVYHKPSTLFKNDIFVPIHAGRAVASKNSKDGQNSKKDIKWLMNNLIGDDTGENISYKNREWCELTAIYWAWKNYDKLENPDYIGLMHYRRIFKYNKISQLKKIILDNDIIMPQKYDLVRRGTLSPYQHYKRGKMNHIEDYEKVLDIVRKKYIGYDEAIDTYNNSQYAYFCNMFIMKKELFFNYCEWLFNILNSAEQEIDITNYDIQEKRALARIAEWLLGIYYTNILINKKNNNLKTTEIPVITLNDTSVSKNKILDIIRKIRALYF